MIEARRRKGIPARDLRQLLDPRAGLRQRSEASDQPSAVSHQLYREPQTVALSSSVSIRVHPWFKRLVSCPSWVVRMCPAVIHRGSRPSTPGERDTTPGFGSPSGGPQDDPLIIVAGVGDSAASEHRWGTPAVPGSPRGRGEGTTKYV